MGFLIPVFPDSIVGRIKEYCLALRKHTVHVYFCNFVFLSPGILVFPEGSVSHRVFNSYFAVDRGSENSIVWDIMVTHPRVPGSVCLQASGYALCFRFIQQVVVWHLGEVQVNDTRLLCSSLPSLLFLFLLILSSNIEFPSSLLAHSLKSRVLPVSLIMGSNLTFLFYEFLQHHSNCTLLLFTLYHTVWMSVVPQLNYKLPKALHFYLLHLIWEPVVPKSWDHQDSLATFTKRRFWLRRQDWDQWHIIP